MSNSTNAHLNKIMGMSQDLESLGHSAAFERVLGQHLATETGSLRVDSAKIPVELIPGWIRDMHDLAPRFSIDGFQASILRDTSVALRPGTWTVSANYTLNEMPYSFWTNGKESWINRTDSVGNSIEHAFGGTGNVTHFLGSLARGLLQTQGESITAPELLLELPKPEKDDYGRINELFIALAGLRGRYQSARNALLPIPTNPDGVGAVYVKQTEGVTPDFKETKMIYHMLSFSEFDPVCSLLTVSNTQRSNAKETWWEKQFAIERQLPIISPEDLQLELDLGLLDDPASIANANRYVPNDNSFAFEAASARVMRALQPLIVEVNYLDGKNQEPVTPEELTYTPPELD